MTRLLHISAHYDDGTARLTLVEHRDDGMFAPSDITGYGAAKVQAFYETPRGWTAWLLDMPMSWVRLETDENGHMRGAYVRSPKNADNEQTCSEFMLKARDRNRRVNWPAPRNRGAA